MENGLLTADEAAAWLNVKRTTIYAYVSRGLLKRQEIAGARGSFFDAMEVRRLADRGRKTAKTSGPSPSFKSAITSIREDGVFYRGMPACDLATTESFEAVAHLLWEDDLGKGTPFEPRAEVTELLGRCGENLPAATLPFDRVKAIVPFAAAMDPLRHDHTTFSVVRRMRMLMASLIEALPERSPRATDVEHAFAARLWSRLSPTPPAPELLTALNAALILAADADVTSPTTIAARMAASVRADIYSVVTAGLHCSGGSVQTASALAVEGYLKILDGQDSLSVAVGEKLRQGEMLPGFGHRRFPGGDPRARALLDMLLRSDPGSARVSRLAEFLELQKERGIAPPNIGFAIAALAYVGGLDRGAGDLVFSMARTAGWGAHAIEQYHSDQDLGRPPSIYVGRLPLAEA